MEGKLLFTQPNDNNWRKGRTIKLMPINALLVTNGKVISFNFHRILCNVRYSCNVKIIIMFLKTFYYLGGYSNISEIICLTNTF